MPRRLPDRWQPDSIREFWAASTERYLDGVALAIQGRRAGAIYVWGYCAEMILKAAYFAVRGFAPDRPIAVHPDIRDAIHRGRTVFSIGWPPQGDGHNARAWAELLIAERGAAGAAYPLPFGRGVQECGQHVGRLWSETLRYHKNVAYLYEARQVQNAVDWLRANADDL